MLTTALEDRSKAREQVGLGWRMGGGWVEVEGCEGLGSRRWQVAVGCMRPEPGTELADTCTTLTHSAWPTYLPALLSSFPPPTFKDVCPHAGGDGQGPRRLHRVPLCGAERLDGAPTGRRAGMCAAGSVCCRLTGCCCMPCSQCNVPSIHTPLPSQSTPAQAEVKAATEEVERLVAEGVFDRTDCGLLHGQMKPVDKEAVLQRFKAGAIKVLVRCVGRRVGGWGRGATPACMGQVKGTGKGRHPALLPHPHSRVPACCLPAVPPTPAAAPRWWRWAWMCRRPQ